MVETVKISHGWSILFILTLTTTFFKLKKDLKNNSIPTNEHNKNCTSTMNKLSQNTIFSCIFLHIPKLNFLSFYKMHAFQFLKGAFYHNNNECMPCQISTFFLLFIKWRCNNAYKRIEWDRATTTTNKQKKENVHLLCILNSLSVQLKGPLEWILEW